LPLLPIVKLESNTEQPVETNAGLSLGYDEAITPILIHERSFSRSGIHYATTQIKKRNGGKKKDLQ
jgi:hypothetical protein